VSLEQTHNFAGGTVWPLEQYRAVSEVAHAGGAAVHVDGARLPNAVVASGVPFRTWAEPVDSLWIDFTKGLGAPIGAVLAGSTDLVARARRYKHVFGAAMRQAGIAAAGCLHALDHHVERLADDHRRAARLGAGLAEVGCRVDPVETNIVFFDPPVDRAGFLARLAAEGVRMGTVDGRVRAVTHLDVDDAGIDAALAAARAVLVPYAPR
jgi:threonine aldolase